MGSKTPIGTVKIAKVVEIFEVVERETVLTWNDLNDPTW
jgi:hypothetical protein